MPRSLAGHFLIASPYLSDRNFFRSVVLIVSHDEEHAFGFLLNRCSDASISDNWLSATGESCGRDEKLRCGGPLEGPIMLIHDAPEFAESQIVSGVFISTSPEMVGRALDGHFGYFVPIAGYSGWGPGQLESELKIGGWMTRPANQEIVFADPDEMWNLAAAQVTQEILPGVRHRHTPIDPQMN
jgi:putative transcriptional regulator